MLYKILLTYWKYDEYTSIFTRYNSGSIYTYDYQLVNSTLNGCSNFNYVIDGIDSDLIISDMNLFLNNTSINAPDDVTFSQPLDRSVLTNYGLFNDLYNPLITDIGGHTTVIGLVKIFSYHNGYYDDSGTRIEHPDADSNYRFGEISTYDEFIGTDTVPAPLGSEIIEYIPMFVGIIYENSYSFDITKNSGYIKIYALDKLLKYIKTSNLNIYPGINVTELVDQIKTKLAGFVDEVDITQTNMGNFMFLKRVALVENIKNGSGGTWNLDRCKFALNPLDNNTPRIITNDYGTGVRFSTYDLESHWILIDDNIQKYLNILYDRTTDGISISTPTNVIPSYFENDCQGFDTLERDRLSRFINLYSFCDYNPNKHIKNATYDYGYYKHPFLPNKMRQETSFWSPSPDYGSRYYDAAWFENFYNIHDYPACTGITNTNGMIGIGRNFNDYWYYAETGSDLNNRDFLGYLKWDDIPVNDNRYFILDYGCTNIYSSIDEDMSCTFKLISEHGGYVYSYYGWKRFMFLDTNKKTIYLRKAPEFGSEYITLHGERFLQIRKDFQYRTVDMGFVFHITMVDELMSGTVKTIAPSLGYSNDLYYINDTTNTQYNCIFNKYPIYWVDDDGISKCTASMCAFNGGLYDVDGPNYMDNTDPLLTYNDNILDSRNVSKYYHVYNIEGNIPSDCPEKPLYLLTTDNQLEIWFYSTERKTLECYDWQFRIKYAYPFGLELNQVAIGVTNKNEILFATITDGAFTLFKHQLTNEVILTDVRNTESVETLLTNICNMTFSVYNFYIKPESLFTEDDIILKITPRYNGEYRGPIPVLYNADLNIDLNLSENTDKPNLPIVKTLWDKYAKNIIFDTSYGEFNIGIKNTFYEYTYKFQDNFYNKPYFEKLGFYILNIIGGRRFILDFYTHALYLNTYDRINISIRIDDISSIASSYTLCVLSNEIDNKLLTSNIKAILFDVISICSTSVLECVIKGLYWTLNDYTWHHNSWYSDCACTECIDELNDLIDDIISLLNYLEYFPITPVEAYSSEDVLVEIFSLVSSNLYYSNPATDRILVNTLYAFTRCVIYNCSYDCR